MSKKKKLARILIAAGLVVVLATGIGLWVYFGNAAWQPTPELALKEAAWPDKESDYTIKIHYDTIYFQEIAVIVYYSESNKACIAYCPYSKTRKKYAAQGFGFYDLEDDFYVQYLLKEPTKPEDVEDNYKNSLILNAFIISDKQAYINGEKAETIRFQVSTSTNTYNVQYWYMELDKNTQYTVEYRES